MSFLVRARRGVVVLMVLASACGDEPKGFTPVTASATVGPAGGAVSATGTDGTRYDLVVPAGALRADATLSLTTAPLVATSGSASSSGRPDLVLEPGLAATLTVHLAGSALPTTAGLSRDGALVPFARNPDGAVAVELRAIAPAPRRARPPAARACTSRTAPAPRRPPTPKE